MSRDIAQLVIVQYRSRAHPVTLVVFFQVTEKGSLYFDSPCGLVKMQHNSKKYTAIIHTETSNRIYLLNSTKA